MKTFDVLRRPQIGSVRDFLEDLEQVRQISEQPELGETWYFRGSSAHKKIVPTIGDVVRYCGLEVQLDSTQEKILLDQFRRNAYQELNRVPSEWEALFLSRHYGLPARILDWSSNPLVALYFSCNPLQEKPSGGAIWGILKSKNARDVNIFQQQNPFELLEPELHGVKLIYPIYNSRRISAQKGIFTWHSHPGKPLDEYDGVAFEDHALDIGRLVFWPVDCGNRLYIVRDLERLGVTQRTIFPDLSGIAQGLWQSMVLWNDK